MARKSNEKVRLFLTGGDYSNDFSNAAPLHEALVDMENEIAMNPGEVAVLIVPADKSKEEVLELLDSMREAVEEGMDE